MAQHMCNIATRVDPCLFETLPAVAAKRVFLTDPWLTLAMEEENGISKPQDGSPSPIRTHKNSDTKKFR